MEVQDHRFAHRLLSSLRSGIVAVDAEGALAACNAEAQRILGCPTGPPAASLGMPCTLAFGAQPAVAELLMNALSGGEFPTRNEIRLEPGPGLEARTIGFTLIPVSRGDGSVDGAALLFRDLTSYERRDEQDRLRERLAALGEMAAGLAHEIRNPLASMEVLVGLLKRRLGRKPEELALLAELKRELRTLADTVTASLEFVRPLEPVRTPVDPVELLEESLALARSRVSFCGAIERDYAEDAPTLLADGEQLRTVVTNLIINALEAMAGTEDGGEHVLRLGLRITPHTEGRPAGFGRGGENGAESGEVPRRVSLFVADTGGGVSDELRERIFYPFFTTKERGSGVGLANAQKVVASHGGSIELESAMGQGSRFSMVLPLSDEDAPCG
jgi:signal transduction histidine kinase